MTTKTNCTYAYRTVVHDISELGLSDLTDEIGLKDRAHLLHLVLNFLMYETAYPETIYNFHLRDEFYRLGMPIRDSFLIGNWVVDNLHRLSEMFGELLQRNDLVVDEVSIRGHVACFRFLTLEDDP